MVEEEILLADPLSQVQVPPLRNVCVYVAGNVSTCLLKVYQLLNI
jgi:hypothetical protein